MIGARIGPYEVVGKLGAGGMGEVFRARDERLGREVALKVLPEAFTADPERLARFEREARVLASLNHPHIAQVYGLEVSGETRALVLELVEGPTLAERLAEGALPLEEALALGRQIAEALEAAHEKGIVHRDLKPGNVKLTPEGRAKVLDFGLAKALESDGGTSSASQLAHSPTLTQGATALGMILGTAAYMAPEQAKGKPVDKRADVWAFGALLFEMLSGQRLFEGETVTETLAAVLRAEIDWSTLPAGLPAPLRNLLRRCLEREPRRRLHDIADARIVLEELAEGRWTEAPAAAPVVAAPRRRGLGWAVAFALGALFATVPWLLSRSASPPARAPLPRAHFEQLTFFAGGEWAPALAPDGESFAYVREIDGQTDVFLQRVGGNKAVNLTAGCDRDDGEPAFSPDGQRIAYRSECGGGGIFVMGAMGESARKVTDKGYNPDWSPDGGELAIADEKLQSPFGRGTSSRIWAVRVETGERRALAAADGVEPSWSPDGRRVAFWGLQGESAARDLYTVAADGSQSAAPGASPVLLDPPVDWSPVWIEQGRALLFASTRGGTMNLWRIGVDPASGKATGEPEPVTVPTSWAGYLSASADGRRVAFVDRNVRTAIRLAPFDPARAEIVGPVQSLPLGTFEVGNSVDQAPGGDGVLFDSSGLPQHLYLAGPGGELRQLTDGPHRDRQGSFSPDGSWIVFQTDRWRSRLGRIRADGSGLGELAIGSEASAWYPIVSPDGGWLVASSTDGAFRAPLRGEQAAGPVELLPAPGDDLAFWPYSFSEDGRRLAGTLVSTANVSVGAAILDLERGVYRRIADAQIEQVRFLPGGGGVLLSTLARIERLDLATGARREIYAAPAGTQIIWTDLSRDGRRLAWNETADESDLWLASFEPAP